VVLAVCGVGWCWLWCCGVGRLVVLVALCCAAVPFVLVVLVWLVCPVLAVCLLFWWCWLRILQGWRAALAWGLGGL